MSTTARPVSSSAVRLLAGFAVLTAAGCGSEDPGTADGESYTVGIVADEYTFRADEAIEVRAGDTVTFDVRNEGEVDHRLEVLTSESRSLGATERIAPGARDEVTVTFEDEGVYRVICDVDDHLSRGQQAQFRVEPAV